MRRLALHSRVILVAALLAAGHAAHAQPERLAGVDQLKAAFVYNFTRYFTWPRSRGEGDFNLCIDNDQVAGGEFESLEGQLTQDRPIVLHRTPASTAAIADLCHVWFVAAPDFDARRERLAELAQSPVLVVSDAAGSRNAGAVIELAVVNSRVQFRVNTSLINDKGLSASAFLLRLAQ